MPRRSNNTHRRTTHTNQPTQNTQRNPQRRRARVETARQAPIQGRLIRTLAKAAIGTSAVVVATKMAKMAITANRSTHTLPCVPGTYGSKPFNEIAYSVHQSGVPFEKMRRYSSEMLYRGDVRQPAQVFREGFKPDIEPRPNETPNADHTREKKGADYKFVSTSDRPFVANRFAHRATAKIIERRGGGSNSKCVYEIRAPKGGYDVSKVEGNRYTHEGEKAFRNIDKRNIRGCIKLTPNEDRKDTVHTVMKQYIPNPHYKES